MKIKTVDMVRQIRQRHYELLKEKTFEERKRFYEQRTEVVRKKVEEMRGEIGVKHASS